MHMSSGYALSGRMAVAIVTTSTLSTPLAGFVTFFLAAETAVRCRAQQQQVRFRALNPRDPSTIIPNNSPPAARVARTPIPTTDAHCSYLACLGCGCRGWRPMDEQHGPRTSSFFMGPGAKSWAVVVVSPDAFFRGSDAFYDFRCDVLLFCVPEAGVGDKARTWTDTL